MYIKGLFDKNTIINIEYNHRGIGAPGYEFFHIV